MKGIELWPWTWPDPDASPSARAGPKLPIYGAYDCKVCEATKTPAIRALMHCGWIPREKWPPGRGQLPKAFGPGLYDLDICPGAIVRSDAVASAAEAFEALEAFHTLEHFDPYHRRTVFQAANLARRAVKQVEAYRAKRTAERIARGGR